MNNIKPQRKCVLKTINKETTITKSIRSNKSVSHSFFNDRIEKSKERQQAIQLNKNNGMKEYDIKFKKQTYNNSFEIALFNHSLKEIKVIQRKWRIFNNKRHISAMKIQCLFKGYIFRKILRDIQLANDKIEQMLLIILTVLFAHYFDIKYTTDYIINKKAKGFLKKLIIVQRKYRKYFTRRKLKYDFWNNYFLANISLIRKRPIINAITSKKYILPIKTVIILQANIKSFLLNKKANEEALKKLPMINTTFITKRRKQNILLTEFYIASSTLKKRVLLLRHSYYSKIIPKRFNPIIYLQRNIKQFVQLTAYQRTIRILPLNSKSKNMVMTKQVTFNKTSLIILIQTSIKLFLLRKISKQLRFNKTILMPSIYSKRIVKKSTMSFITKEKLFEATHGNCKYFALKLLIIIKFALKRKYFNQLRRRNEGCQPKSNMTLIKKIEWSYYSNDIIKNSKEDELDLCFDDEDTMNIPVCPIKQFKLVQMRKYYNETSSSCSRIKSQESKIEEENETYSNLFKMKQSNEEQMNSMSNYHSYLFFNEENSNNI